MHRLRSGTSLLPLPPGLDTLPVIAREEPAPLYDCARTLRDLLGSPSFGPPLTEFLRGRRRVALVVPDATRALPRAVLDGLLDALAGREVRVRVANGTHRRATEAEQRALLGARSGQLPVGDRSADDPGAHRGVDGDIGLDREALDCDALVLAGPASFHYLAGFGGGAKLIAPGLANRAGAEFVHRACLAAEGGRHPRARAGVLDGNPMRERAEQLAGLAPPQFYVIPVLDSAGRPVALFTGERQPSFAAACAALRAHYAVETPLRSTVIVSAGGAPYDIDFVQAHKALEAAAAACRPGGTIVFVASAAEGLLPRHCAFLETHREAASMEQALRERFDIAAHTVWAARLKAERFRILAVTDLPAALADALGLERRPTLAAALADCDLSDAALLPYGARFLPVAR